MSCKLIDYITSHSTGSYWCIGFLINIINIYYRALNDNLLTGFDIEDIFSGSDNNLREL